MTPRSSSAEDYGGRPIRPADQGTAGLSLFDQPTPAPESPAERRRQKARVLERDGWQRWIDHGKPIALLVAAQDGTVTAETFRSAAEQMPHALPPTYGNQRALAYLPAMFAELVAEGHLEKVRHPNGAPVKVYSKAQGNDQVVYRLAVPL